MDTYVCLHCEEQRKYYPPCTLAWDTTTKRWTNCECYGCTGSFLDCDEPNPHWVDD